jgi:uncharacterized cupredoxin-like copper-binding protein
MASMRMPFNAHRGLVLGICFAASLGAVAPAVAVTHASATTVVITMTDAKLESAPVVAQPGIVLFRVVNQGTRSRNFEIAGKSTPQIAAGKSATLRVSFPKPGSFLYLSYGPGRTRGLSNEFRIVGTCLHPAKSTVRVQMKRAPIMVSRSTVPCGTVTFVVTNVDKIIHSFWIFTPNNNGVAPPGGKGPVVRPGKSVRMTVKFTTTGRAFYECGVIEHGEIYSETGYLVVV